MPSPIESQAAAAPSSLLNYLLANNEGLSEYITAAFMHVKDDKRRPANTFVPVKKYLEFFMENGLAERLSTATTAQLALVSELVSVASVVYPWRFSQSIYMLDKYLQEALVQTELSGTLPTQVLRRIPEWSIYIALAEPLTLSTIKDCIGLFVSRTVEVEDRDILQILLLTADCKFDVKVIPLLDDITLFFTSAQMPLKLTQIESLTTSHLSRSLRK